MLTPVDIRNIKQAQRIITYVRTKKIKGDPKRPMLVANMATLLECLLKIIAVQAGL